MNKIAKKILSCAVVGTMVVGLVGCGAEETTSTSTTTSTPAATTTEATPAPEAEATPVPPLAISVSLPTNDEHLEQNDYYDRLVQEINEYTNMDITWEWNNDATYYDDEHLGLKIATADVADVIVTGKTAAFLAAAEEGLFWDLADYIDEFDNLATIPQATRMNASYNGKMYGLPRSRTLARNGLGYRLDWVENLGLKEPTTWDEYKDMLYAFTYNDPDGDGADNTVGLGLDSWTGVFNIIGTWFGVPNEWGIDANGDLIYYAVTEEFKTAMTAVRELYDLGVINNGSNGIPDFMEVAAGATRKELLNNGLAGSGIQVLDDQRKVETYFEDQGLADPEEPIYTLAGYIDTGKGALCYPTTGMNNLIAISTKTVKTEEQLRQVLGFLNDMNDGVIMNLIEYGWEGITYDLDENGYIVLKSGDELGAAGISTTYRNGFNQVIPYFTAAENDRPQTVAPASTVVTKLEQQLYADDIKYCVANFGAQYTSQTMVEQGGALGTIINDAMIGYIKGEIDEAAFDAAIESWKTAGGDTVTAEMNALYHAAGN